jgi:hypothetical protein
MKTTNKKDNPTKKEDTMTYLTQIERDKKRLMKEIKAIETLTAGLKNIEKNEIYTQEETRHLKSLMNDGEPYGKCRRFRLCSQGYSRKIGRVGHIVPIAKCHSCYDYLRGGK